MRTLNMLVVAAIVVGSVASPVFAAKPDPLPVVVNGNTQFALELYSKLAKSDGNLFFSPYSISTALAMTHAGARGNTAKQMADVMHFNIKGDDLHRTFGSLVNTLNKSGDKGPYQLAVANALWGQKAYRFLKPFTNLVEKNYDAGMNRVDFKTQTEAARLTINRWVEDNTNNKIRDLLKKGILTPLTRLVLTNAIYFKGDWASQFKKDATRDMPFTLAGGKKIDVPMMYQKQKFKYGETRDCQMLELPYKGNDLSMVVFLPKKASGLAALEKKLTPKSIAQWTRRMWKRKVYVYLPKFKMTCEFGLKDVLIKMGMKDAFTPGVADLSGMDGTKYLFISAVVHKAFVDVNEEGTEAAAATAVVVATKSLAPRPLIFKADRPFIFIIRHNQTGSILFLGRAANPKGK
jgi:serine protease inhibitor